MHKVSITLLFLSALLFSCSSTTTKTKAVPASPLDLYNGNCGICHGDDGAKGLSGAKDLSITQMTTEELLVIIQNGKGGMAGFKTLLSAEEIDLLVQHVQSLKK